MTYGELLQQLSAAVKAQDFDAAAALISTNVKVKAERNIILQHITPRAAAEISKRLK